LLLNAYTKVAQAVIRLVAFASVVISLLLFADDLYLQFNAHGFDTDLHGTHYVVIHVHTLILKAIPLIIGLILFWKSRALAERLTKDLD
jgi:hypothetical protein